MIQKSLITNIPPRVDVIGVPISAVNMKICLDFMFSNWEAMRGNYICVSNVHTTVMAREEEDYFQIQSNSLLSLPDGKPLSIIGKRKYKNMDRVTGPDLMREIFALSKDKEIKHFFYGTTKENLEVLINKIKQDYPYVNIVGYEPSVFRELDETEEKDLVQRINSKNPDILWVALGAPKQEQFCYRNEGKIDALMIGVGGAFNIISGLISEAPRWMQNISMEWFYRLLKEPRRLFKRYFVTNLKFIKYLLFGGKT